MNILDEMDRLTAPQFVKSTGRSLSREEIEKLQAEGKITPPENIPYAHMQGRVSVPERCHFSTYDRACRNGGRYV